MLTLHSFLVVTLSFKLHAVFSLPLEKQKVRHFTAEDCLSYAKYDATNVVY